MRIDFDLKAADLSPSLDALFSVAAKSVAALRKRWNPADGTPVFTEAGLYTSRGWTEWTQGFQYGLALLLFEATGNGEMLDYGRRATMDRMAPHLTHTGVHDHGFNNVSTYGTLLRFMAEGLTPESQWERASYELALKVTGAVQAARWTSLPDDLGYVCSFNGPHSLFADTIRSMRALALSHKLGHVLMGEQDARISLLGRLLIHAETTARFNVYFGDGRDSYDERGRVAHESIFNLQSGAYRCPSSQQGYSPFSTWTRGQAWILCGYPEQMEFIESIPDGQIEATGFPALPTKQAVLKRFLETARATANHVIANTPTDGVPYWDTGAPGLANLGDYLERPADPYNDHEPVDSSAAAIWAQGLLRLGDYMMRNAAVGSRAETAAPGFTVEEGRKYFQAGLTVAQAILKAPYLAEDPSHEGILLHSIYHRPNGWDHVAPGQKIPNGESSMWGDYHALELGVMLKRLADGRRVQRFFDIEPGEATNE